MPLPPTPFVGRRSEVAEVRRLVAAARVVTLAGPPGVGKTRIALHAAHDLARSFRDGVFFVELGGLRDAGLLAQEVARGLGLHDASTRWALDELVRHVGNRQLLVVLDNCEHLLDAAALLLDSMVRRCGELRVVATSRQSLGVSGETVLRVPPLSVPEHGSTQAESLELLVARAEAIQPGHSIGHDEMEAAAELCRRLDGIPLAIELAAVRLKTLSLEQILARIDDRFGVLGEGNRTSPAHQRTLRATLDWSRELAAGDEWLLWRRLSVFPTSFDLVAVESICADDGLEARAVLRVLDGLVDKSIVAATRAGPTMRYRLLDSIRDYGAEGLSASGEAGSLRRRHAHYYAQLCEEAWRHWAGPDQSSWFDRLDVEHGNLRAALDWCVANDEAELGAAMAGDMWLYWGARGHLTEGRKRLAALLERLPERSGVRAKSLWVAGYLALGQVDADAAAPLLEASVELGTGLADLESVAFATQYLGLCALFTGDLAVAAETLERAFELHTRCGGRAAAFTLTDLAITLMLAGETSRAADLYERSLAMAEDSWTRSHCLWGAGLTKWLGGDVEGAERVEKEALRLIAELDERSGMALCLEALAWIAVSRHDLERGAVLQGAAHSIWESIPGHLPRPLRGHGEQCSRRIREGLGDGARDRLFARGRDLDRGAAVACALEAKAEPVAGAAATRQGGVLSRRELEVARLVAAGLTDRDIATRLVISQRTAESHLQHILAKLGFRSRSQIAAWLAATGD